MINDYTNYKCECVFLHFFNICSAFFFSFALLTVQAERLQKKMQPPKRAPKVKPINCPVCGKQFKNGTKHLNVHLKRLHRNQSEKGKEKGEVVNWKKYLREKYTKQFQL